MVDEANRVVLAIGAHPDDAEGLCGGTLAKYKDKGWKVVIAHATNGDKGHSELSPKEVAEIRRAEAQKAADVIGAEMVWLGLEDEFLFSDKDTRLTFIDLIRSVRPDVILCHSPEDYHPDHKAVATLTVDASYAASLSLVKSQHTSFSTVPPILFADTIGGIDFFPTDFVDITEAFDRKKKMLLQHKSQREFIKGHHELDQITLIEIMARFRGLQCSVQYAEGFRPFRAWPRLAAERLLP